MPIVRVVNVVDSGALRSPEIWRFTFNRQWILRWHDAARVFSLLFFTLDLGGGCGSPRGLSIVVSRPDE